MKTVLICNIGGSDVCLDGKPPPKESMRAKGEELLKDYQHYRHRITTPLVDQAIQHVSEVLCAGKIDRLALVVSDQADPAHRESDTVYCGEVIKARAEDLHRGKVEKAIVARMREDVNPADYDDTLKWFSDWLARERKLQTEDTDWFLLLSGGTPAMNNALLLRGVDTFEARATCLYLPRGAETPLTLRIGATLRVRSVCESVRAAVRSYAYGAALSLAEAQSDLFPDRNRFTVLTSLLAYGRSRYAFDFEAARRSLTQAVTPSSGAMRTEINTHCEDLAVRDTHWLLRETLFAAEARFQAEGWTDFLGHIFKFQEGMLHSALRECGVQFDKTGLRLDLTWVETTPGLKDYLATYPHCRDGINPQQELTRLAMEATLRFLADERSDGRAADVRASLSSLNRLSELRNDVMHGTEFPGLSREVLSREFGEEAAGLPSALRLAYVALCGCDPGPNPFMKLNDLIERVLEVETN